jgi:electron transfer flavoprotein alpha subunit
MNRILIIAEHDGNEINSSTLKCVSCAKDIESANIDIVICAQDGANIAEAASKIDHINSVILIDNEANENMIAAIIAPQIISMSDKYTHIFGPSTTFGKDLMPRIAALLNVNQISDIMEVINAYEFKRPIYAGNAIVSIKASADKKIVGTIRTASFQDAQTDNSVEIHNHEISIDLPNHTRFKSLQTGESDRPDLQTAKKVVSGGRALGSEENFEIIYQLADTMNAGAGASRAAVDAGYVPNEMQVGQTGKIIAPDLYLAIGISGAIQHLTGIKDAGTIVAINKDEEAPIFEIADIGLVGDLFDVIPELEAELKNRN